VTRQIGLWAVGLALTAAVMTSGCVQQEGKNWLGSGDPFPEIREFAIKYTKEGKYCGAKTPLRLVVRDAAHMALVPVGDVPVNFETDMVLFVTLGQVYSDSYGIRIERVWQQGQVLKVGIAVAHPEPGEMGVPQPCSPYYLAVVPKSDLNVEGFVTEVALPNLEGSGGVPALRKRS